MELTKHAHACVTLSQGDGRLLIDPGVYTPDAVELIGQSATVLITHEHPDHFHEEAIAAALDERPELRVYGPAAVVNRWQGRPGQITAVAEGDRLQLEGFDVAVFGDLHAPIHADVPRCANVGYLVDGRVYHPGDAYYVPPAPVTTLLLPTSGPWTKLGEAVDYVRAVDPGQVLQIHELMLSEMGQRSTAQFLSPPNLGRVPLTIVALGDTVPL
jgi:L-ascorbate metabolism protein UlaG (beta-lactamase superfamily)